MIEAIKAFEGGFCRHLLGVIDRKTWRVVNFPALYFALKHPREGWVLVDTGYGGNFEAATEGWPYRLYRWVTPVTSVGTVTEQLRTAGIASSEIRHVILTHFHADHIGGLREFAESRIHFHEDAWKSLQGLSPFRQVRAAYLPALIPKWLADRAEPVKAEAFAIGRDLPFPTHDLFGDGVLQLVYLPGHAPGQIGLSFASPRGQELYAADAYWRRCQVETNTDPLLPAMAVQWNVAAYRATIRCLRELHTKRSHYLMACHDTGVCTELNALNRT